MIQININEEQAGLLREILANDLSDLGYEIANTDGKDYRDQLRAKQELLRQVLEQFPEA